MTEIWTIVIIALSSSGISLGANQLTRHNAVGGQNYFSNYDECALELKNFSANLITAVISPNFTIFQTN